MKVSLRYQLDLCQKALSENIIAYLATGSGKTHIAVLLIHEMRHMIKKPQKDICVFLAPTVALVEQVTQSSFCYQLFYIFLYINQPRLIQILVYCVIDMSLFFKASQSH